MDQSAPKPAEWFLDEAFWSALAPFLFPASMFASAAERVPDLLALAGRAPDADGGAVLDLACGAGRYAVPLAKRGYSVTGVDANSSFLDQARAYARSEGVTVEWIREDMRRFQRPGAYDLALSLFTSFGYFEEPEENRAMLRNVRGCLKPGGAFVLDVLGKEVLARIFQPTTSVELPEAGLLIQRHRIHDDWTRIENEWIVMKGEQAATFRFRHWLYSAAELADLLRSVGFPSVRLFGDFAGSPYDSDAKRLIAVARYD
jgi:SAM-dependent methyltransferase